MTIAKETPPGPAAPAAGPAAAQAAPAPGAHGPQAPHGYSKDKEAHLKRLRRIEGQVRGLQRMVEDEAYCIDILTQVSASTKALQSFALQLLEEHLRHCVAHAATEGGPAIGTTEPRIPHVKLASYEGIVPKSTDWRTLGVHDLSEAASVN
jgi:DNA-binding FrmR family transcriptional regulator